VPPLRRPARRCRPRRCGTKDDDGRIRQARSRGGGQGDCAGRLGTRSLPTGRSVGPGSNLLKRCDSSCRLDAVPRYGRRDGCRGRGSVSVRFVAFGPFPFAFFQSGFLRLFFLLPLLLCAFSLLVFQLSPLFLSVFFALAFFLLFLASFFEFLQRLFLRTGRFGATHVAGAPDQKCRDRQGCYLRTPHPGPLPISSPPDNPASRGLSIFVESQAPSTTIGNLTPQGHLTNTGIVCAGAEPKIATVRRPRHPGPQPRHSVAQGPTVAVHRRSSGVPLPGRDLQAGGPTRVPLKEHLGSSPCCGLSQRRADQPDEVGR